MPFTRIGRIQAVKEEASVKEKQLSILIYTVYQFNPHYALGLRYTCPPYAYAEARSSAKASAARGQHRRYKTLAGEDCLMHNAGSINGSKVRILGIHLKPPVTGEPYSSKSKDRELVQAAIYLNK